MKKQLLINFLIFLGFWTQVTAQFVHPGITHKKSDLDRMKYMVEAQIDPWYSSYQEMISDSKSSYDYSVEGDASFTLLERDSPRTNYNAWNSDIRAAYYNAIQWYITGDSRHADKAVEIFNAWKNLTSVTSNGTDALSAGIGYIMIEAAEIIKSTYTGWSDEDISDFQDMLVYPGYSTTTVPSGDTTFYWKGYQGDAIRHGNQGLSGFRTIMAIGIFLDNEIIYDRVLRYISGESHRSDDFPYPAGPNTSTSVSDSTDFVDTYSVTRGYSTDDYGYDEVLTNYIYENGQCQESSRDHQHTTYGIGNLNSIAEMSWNQGDDIYSHADDRLLLGLEYNMRYNLSAIQSYADQTSSWEPTVASGEFIEGFERTGRWYSKAISTTGRGEIFDGVRPVFEMPVAHYVGRGFKTEDEVKWTIRARDKAIEDSGYEDAGFSNDAIGWGALVSRRVDNCYGDPISGFDAEGLPNYAMNVLPMTIEAENYDYSPVIGEGRTYSDTSDGNTGDEYRTDDNVDIQTRTGGGYNVGWIQPNEWLTYTVYVPETGTYDLSIDYAAISSGGQIKIEFGGVDKTGEVALPATGGIQVWSALSVGTEVNLTQGVQSMKVLFSGTGGVFNLNNITIDDSEISSAFTPDPDKTYYLDVPYHELRLAATGESEDAYTTSTDTTGEDVEWQFVDKGNGSWHIQIAAGGTTPRLRTDNSEFADMQGTAWSGSYTYYNFTEGATNGTYFITLTDGPLDYQRLQVDSDGIVKMVTSDHDGTWESFTITEVEAVNEAPLRIEAEDYDGMSGVQAEVSTESGDNIGYINDGDWLRFDDINLSGFSNMDVRVASNFTGGTIEVRSGSTTGTLLGSVLVTDTGGNQEWITENTSLLNATGTQDVYLVFTGGSGFLFNVNWIEFNNETTTSNKDITALGITEVLIYPNPVVSITTIQATINSILNIYDMNGAKVFVKSIASESETIDLSVLTAGIYYAKVENKTEGVSIIKIIKQ